ncbi:hypothetical protein FOZ63_003084 [Perkinsus olseni]|uniref:Uncharacterized protein n=1 Tax=Perkinsus olseni TaxID=32597 RepID=A0A7J6QEQ5_PEROL|nr:hypothetical protein FOZ63_003084 [Perkinsus olseni]
MGPSVAQELPDGLREDVLRSPDTDWAPKASSLEPDVFEESSEIVASIRVFADYDTICSYLARIKLYETERLPYLSSLSLQIQRHQKHHPDAPLNYTTDIYIVQAAAASSQQSKARLSFAHFMLSKGSLLMINRRCGDFTGDLRYPLDSKDADSSIDYDTHFAGSFPQFPSLQGFTDFSYKLDNVEAAMNWLYTGFVNKETSFIKTGNMEPRTDLSANQIFMASLCHYPMDEDETITFCWGQKERRMLSSRSLPVVRFLATLSVMVSSITGISLFVCLAFDYSLVCEATYGLTREVIERKRKGENQFKDIRARKTDLPSFDDVLGPAVRGQSTLKVS